MTIAHLLEDFTASTLDEPLKLMTDEALEELRLMAFEQGYSSGWEDSLAAQVQEKSRLSSVLASNLEDMSFTYFDALAQMSENLVPLFETVTQKVLPGALMASHGHHIVEQLHALARERIDQPISVTVASGQGSIVKPLLDHEFSAPVEVAEDETLEQGQAYLSVGAAELALDGKAMLESIQEAMDAYNFQFREGKING